MNKNMNDIVLNENYIVKRKDETLCKATIIESRTLNGNQIEYFVHYHGHDRRLDEWVSPENIDVSSRFEIKDDSCSNILSMTPECSDGRLTRHQKRKINEIYHGRSIDDTPMDSITQKLEKEHQAFTRVKYIETIRLGCYEIDTWYFSPYPEEYRRLRKLFICEYCLKYMKLEDSFIFHQSQCLQRQPPGKEIYRNGNLSVFEIDGQEMKLYCQNLCLLAKLFLDHKTLYYDVAPFMFYVLCEVDREGCHLVGYFSKEKISIDNYNLACILTLPPFQRKGYGKFLIAFSYELAKIEKMIGSPEKPLSDLGWLSYRSYWEYVIFTYLLDNPNSSIDDISNATCIAIDDIKSVLESHNLMKYYHRHGKELQISRKSLMLYLENFDNKKPIQIDKSCLKWLPPLKVKVTGKK